jgi:SulP family sulfate permease
MLPYNVISGFMTGIGVILIFMQIAPFLGQATPKGGVIDVIKNLPTLITNLNPWETFLGLITLAILFFYPTSWKKVVPPQLVALVIGTAISLISLVVLRFALLPLLEKLLPVCLNSKCLLLALKLGS